jgi:magnesium transporter
VTAESGESTTPQAPVPEGDLHVDWLLESDDERREWFTLLERPEAEDFFLGIPARDQAALVLSLPAGERRAWVRLLALDDTADLIQEAPPEEREGLLALLDDQTRLEVRALLAFAEDDAGGLMNPRFARVRPEMTADQAIQYLRAQARERLETIYYVYVLDPQQRLLGVVSFRELFGAPAGKLVRDIMHTDVVKAHEAMDQEALSRLFAKTDLIAIPIVDDQDRVKGVVTVDDIVDVVQEEATEDIQKIGGTSALDAPYLQTGLVAMLKKRAGWLAILFVSEMLTTTAMQNYQGELAKAILLAAFIPLIISSGGNSGSQASTLLIRAIALGEVRLRDWWRVMRRELLCGLALGSILGVIGFTRVLVWQAVKPIYGVHYVLVAFTIAGSVIGVVMFGTLAGSMLPFLLKRLGLDPASASAPFVATLVDVTGLIIFFTVAGIILSGTLL